MMGLGYRELLLIFLVILLLFGGRRIPEVARGLGRAMREFRKARDDVRDALESEDTGATQAADLDVDAPGAEPEAGTAPQPDGKA